MKDDTPSCHCFTHFKRAGADHESLRRIEQKLIGREGLLMTLSDRTPFRVGDDALNLAILQVLLQAVQNPASGIGSFKAFEASVDRLLKGSSETDDFYKTVRNHASNLRTALEGQSANPGEPIARIYQNIRKQKGWAPFAAGVIDGVWEVGVATALSALGFTANPAQGLRDLKDLFKIVVYPSFSSTTIDKKLIDQWGFNGNVLLKIKSHTGADLRPLNPGQKEVLFPPDSKFFVTNRRKLPDGQVEIELEQIP